MCDGVSKVINVMIFQNPLSTFFEVDYLKNKRLVQVESP